MRKTVLAVVLLGQIFCTHGIGQIWSHDRIQKEINSIISGDGKTTVDVKTLNAQIEAYRTSQMPDILRKFSCTKQGNEQYEKKLIKLFGLDPKTTEIRYVNADSHNISKELQSAVSVTKLFSERCTFENDEIKEEVLRLVEEGCKQSKIFHDVMLCYLETISKSNYYFSLGRKTFNRSKIGQSYSETSDGSVYLIKDDIYAISQFGGTQLKEQNTFLITLEELYLLFHECGHVISTFFNSLPNGIDNTLSSKDMLNGMNEETQWYWDIISHFVPTSANMDKVNKLIDERARLEERRKKRLEEMFRVSLDEFVYGERRSKNITLERDKDEDICNEVRYIVNDFDEHIMTVTIPVRKDRSKLFLYLCDGRNKSEAQLYNGQKRYLYRDIYGNIVGEKIIDEKGNELGVSYRLDMDFMKIDFDRDKLEVAAELWKKCSKKKFSSTAERTRMLAKPRTEVWQILGIAPVKQKDGKAIVYINELSDFALYASLGMPLRLNHAGGATVNDLVELVSLFKFDKVDEELLDVLLHLHGTSLSEYTARLNNWLDSHSERRNQQIPD